MNNVVRLLNGESVNMLSVDDVLYFVSLYPEWLSRSTTLWSEIVSVRNHILYGCDLDDTQEKRVLEVFICDIINISLTQYHIFDQFELLTRDGYPFSKYKNCEIQISDFMNIGFNFSILLRNKELSAVTFLLNILREVVE